MLEATNLGQRYGRGPWLFRGLDLQVRPGEITSVLGPNARGKTTLLKTLCGIMVPAEGSVRHDGLVGYVPQVQQGSLSYPVIEIVIMGRAAKLKAFQMPGKRDREVAMECLRRVGIAELADRPFNQLSGGQKQLTLIARALATQPQILVLDEPASALDLRNQVLVLQVAQQLRTEGLGLVITTHDATHAYLVSDQILLMDEAPRPEVGTVDGLLTEDKLSSLYHTRILVAEVAAGDSRQPTVVPDYAAGAGVAYRGKAASRVEAVGASSGEGSCKECGEPRGVDTCDGRHQDCFTTA